MVSYTRKAARGAGISLIFGALASIVAYITRIVMARNMGPEDYGLFYAIFTFVIFFLFFRNLGLQDAITKYIAIYKIDKDYNSIKTSIISVIFMQLISSVIFSIIIFFLADYLSIHYFKDTRAALILKFLIIYIMFSIFFIILKGIFGGFHKFFARASVELSKNIIVLILLVIFLKIKFGILAPVYAYILVCIFLFLVYSPYALKISKFFKSKIVNIKIISKKLLYFGIPVFATSIGGKIIGHIDTLLLTSLASIREVGIYNAVLPSALIILFLGNSVAGIAFPLSSELFHKKEFGKMRKGLELVNKYVFIIITPIIFTIFVYAKELINLIFGKEYLGGTLSFQILLIGIFFYSLAVINNNTISGMGFPKIVMKIILFSALINVFLNILLIPKFGIEGAAIATTISYMITLILSTHNINKKLNIKLSATFWTKIMLCSLIYLIFAQYMRTIFSFHWIVNLIIVSIISSTIYLLSVYILKIISIKEIKNQIKLIL